MLTGRTINEPPRHGMRRQEYARTQPKCLGNRWCNHGTSRIYFDFGKLRWCYFNCSYYNRIMNNVNPIINFQDKYFYDKNAPKLLPLLKAKWDVLHSMLSVFRYKIDNLKVKLVNEKYLLQLNPNRATNRRAPELISDMKQPFSDEKFNFTKVSADEIMFSVGLSAGDPDLHRFIVNVSPISRYHTLFCPFINKKLPQVITEESLYVVTRVLLVAKDCNLKIGFNSLCALASVNHLHFHLFLENNVLPVEKVEWKTLQENLCYIVDYPAPAFCFRVKDNFEEIRELYELIKYLQDESIAHNIFMKITSKLDSVEVYVFPRKSSTGVKQLASFNVAILELCGWFPVFSEEAFINLKSEDLENEIKKWKYSEFSKLLETLPKLLYGDN